MKAAIRNKKTGQFRAMSGKHGGWVHSLYNATLYSKKPTGSCAWWYDAEEMEMVPVIIKLSLEEESKT
jgi:hypothetical protein